MPSHFYICKLRLEEALKCFVAHMNLLSASKIKLLHLKQLWGRALAKLNPGVWWLYLLPYIMFGIYAYKGFFQMEFFLGNASSYHIFGSVHTSNGDSRPGSCHALSPWLPWQLLTLGGFWCFHHVCYSARMHAYTYIRTQRQFETFLAECPSITVKK